MTLRSRFREVHQMMQQVPAPLCDLAIAAYTEDAIVNGVLSPGTPLAMSGFRGRTGLSELPSLTVVIDCRWRERVTIDEVALRTYATAVHRATDAFLARHADRDIPSACVMAGLLARLERMSAAPRPN